MKYSRAYRTILILLIGVSFFLLFGYLSKSKECSDLVERNTEYKEMYQFVCELDNLGDMSLGQDGVDIDYNGFDYRVFMTVDLQKYLSSICENYTKAVEPDEGVSVEQVRTALNDNLKETVEIYRSGDWTSHFLYKLFKWCGTSCKDFVVYDENSGLDWADFEKRTLRGNTTNYDVIVGQSIVKETGEKLDCKFKWQ